MFETLLKTSNVSLLERSETNGVLSSMENSVESSDEGVSPFDLEKRRTVSIRTPARSSVGETYKIQKGKPSAPWMPSWHWFWPEPSKSSEMT